VTRISPRRPLWATITVVLLTAQLGAGCATPRVVAETVPIEVAVASAVAPVEGPEPLLLGIGVSLSPVAIVERYSRLADLLGAALGRPVEILQRRSLQEMVSLLDDGDVDVALLDAGAYVHARNSGAVQLIAAPHWLDDMTPHAVLIAGPSSSARSIGELRGAVLADGDPLSLTGSLYTAALLEAEGLNPESFFSATVTPVGQDRALRAVAAGHADVTAIHERVLRDALAEDPALLGRLTVLDASPSFAGAAIVVPKDTSASFAEALLDALIELGANPSAAGPLGALGLDGFTPATDQLYDTARQVAGMIDGESQ
jgi:phosphonate transport system substrate-binding protein